MGQYFPENRSELGEDMPRGLILLHTNAFCQEVVAPLPIPLTNHFVFAFFQTSGAVQEKGISRALISEYGEKLKYACFIDYLLPLTNVTVEPNVVSPFQSVYPPLGFSGG